MTQGWVKHHLWIDSLKRLLNSDRVLIRRSESILKSKRLSLTENASNFKSGTRPAKKNLIQSLLLIIGTAKDKKINLKKIKLQNISIFKLINVRFRSARGAIIMYDVTRPQTFKSLEKWFQLMSEHGRGDVEVAVVSFPFFQILCIEVF